MSVRKRTYALPEETVAAFEKEVAPADRSSLIAELLQEWLAGREQQRLRQEIIEGCREMADVYLEIEQEYHPLEEEVQDALDTSPKPGRRRPRPARSRRGV